MLDSTSVRAHQCAAGQKSTPGDEALGRSTCRDSCASGFTTKLHALVDALGNPVRLVLTPGQRADITQARSLLSKVEAEAVIAHKGYDADALIERIEAGGATVVIPPKRNRTVRREYDRIFMQTETRLSGSLVGSSSTGESPPATKRPRAVTSPWCRWQPS